MRNRPAVNHQGRLDRQLLLHLPLQHQRQHEPLLHALGIGVDAVVAAALEADALEQGRGVEITDAEEAGEES